MPAKYHKLMTLFLLTAVWVIFSEEFSALTVAGGLFFAVCSLALLHQLRHEHDVTPIIILRPVWLIVYFIYLVGQLYLSGFQMISRILSGRLQAEVVEVETELESDLAISVLAASITLTPGTVTIERRGRILTILRAVPSREQHLPLDRQVKKSLESLLLRQRAKARTVKR